MAMNIKNPQTHEMVKRIARLTGESQEAAVYSAVEVRLRTLLAEERAQQILERGAEIGELLGLVPGADPTADLYDENGLPQ
jgi:antitoxin VapB